MTTTSNDARSQLNQFAQNLARMENSIKQI